MRPGAGRFAIGVAGAVVLVMAGCRTATPPPRSSAGAQASDSVSPSTPKPRHGLTGYPAGIGRPQLAVKIDNTRAAHPQIGVGDADIVYVEQVEGGLTRLLAVFSSRVPSEVGPVRSARESDLVLLRQYGRVDFAFSGANRGVLRRVAQAPVADVSAPRVPAAYRRAAGRRAPYNLFLAPPRALAAKPAAVAADIGLTFSATVPTAGRASTGFSVRYSPYATVAARYAAPQRSWQILTDGRRRPTAGGDPVAPTNVIVQYVSVRTSSFRDVLGNVTPFPVSTGTGDAVVFRDGRAITARWSRPKLADGTRFTGAGGVDVPLRPGPSWILLVPRGLRLGA